MVNFFAITVVLGAGASLPLWGVILASIGLLLLAVGIVVAVCVFIAKNVFKWGKERAENDQENIKKKAQIGRVKKALETLLNKENRSELEKKVYEVFTEYSYDKTRQGWKVANILCKKENTDNINKWLRTIGILNEGESLHDFGNHDLKLALFEYLDEKAGDISSKLDNENETQPLIEVTKKSNVVVSNDMEEKGEAKKEDDLLNLSEEAKEAKETEKNYTDFFFLGFLKDEQQFDIEDNKEKIRKTPTNVYIISQLDEALEIFFQGSGNTLDQTAQNNLSAKVTELKKEFKQIADETNSANDQQQQSQ